MQGQPAGTRPIPCPAHEGRAAADMPALACVQALDLAQAEQAAMRQMGDALAAQGHARTAQGRAPALAGQWTAQQQVRPHPECRALAVTALPLCSARPSWRLNPEDMQRLLASVVARGVPVLTASQMVPVLEASTQQVQGAITIWSS